MDTNIEDRITPEEKELFDLLQSIISVVSPSTTIRAAGGWVRDKLLGKNPDDIDIMVDNMSGAKLGNLVANFMGLKGPNVIKENPDASKHLETATMNIPVPSGKVFELDFAEARQEVYHDDSRIPEIKPATAKEDAQRRDLTINALFYNLKTKQVEDFTGKGLADLENMYFRTPLDPIKTFRDDPIRIFRAIRFIARYGAGPDQIDPAMLEAMSDPSLRQIINDQEKLKTERIMQELVKVSKGANPSIAFNLLKDTGLFRDILEQSIKGTKYEGQIAPLDMGQNNQHHELNVWDHSMKVIENILQFYPDTDPEKRAIMVLSALMHDLGKLHYGIQKQKGNSTSYSGHEKSSADLAEFILKYLKFSGDYIHNVSKNAYHHMRLHELERREPKKTPEAQEKAMLISLRRSIGKMLADGIKATDIMNHSIADAYSKTTGVVSAEVVAKYQKLQSLLEAAYVSIPLLEEASRKIPLILNGNDIKNLGIPYGPMVGEALRFLENLTMENPNITQEEAKMAIRRQYNLPEPSTEIPQTKEASSCPKHLLSKNVEAIHKAIREKNVTLAMSLVRELSTEHDTDDYTLEEIAKAMFHIITLDKTQKDIGVLVPLFESSNKNFFSTKLCIPILGILLTIKTGTEDKVIEEVFERMSNMDSDGVRQMLSHLSKSSERMKLAKQLESKYLG